MGITRYNALSVKKTNKAYLSAITVTNISRSFYLQHGGIDTEQNYVSVSVTLSIRFITNYVCNCNSPFYAGASLAGIEYTV